MPLSTVERSKLAAGKRSENARNRRFRRYAVEMAQAPVPDDVLSILAHELHLRGWLVLAPDRLVPGGLPGRDQITLGNLLHDAGWRVSKS